MDITKESQSEGERGMEVKREPTFDMPTHSVFKPEKFFKDLENNFKKNNITCGWKKFCHALMSLDEKTLRNLRGLKAYRPHSFAYKILKMEVITRCKKRGRKLRMNHGQRSLKNVKSMRIQDSDIDMNCNKNETVTRAHTETTGGASAAETPMEIDDVPVEIEKIPDENLRLYKTLERSLDSLKERISDEVRHNYAIHTACRVNALRESLARISAQAGMVNKLLKSSHEASGKPIDENVTKSLDFLSTKSSEILCKTYTSKSLAAIVEGLPPTTYDENIEEDTATPADDDSETHAENTEEAPATTSANDNTATRAENTGEASGTTPANDDSAPSIDKFITAMSNESVRRKARRIFSPKEYYVLLNFLVKQIKKKAHESAKNGTIVEKMQRWQRCLQTVTDPNYDPTIYEFMLKLHEDGTILRLLKSTQKGPEQEVPQPEEIEDRKETEEQDVPQPLILEEETE